MRIYLKSLISGFERLLTIPRITAPILLTLSLTLATVLAVVAMLSNLAFKSLPDIKDESNLYNLDYKLEMSETLSFSLLTEQRLAELIQQNKHKGTFSTYHVRERQVDFEQTEIKVSKFRASMNFNDNVAELSLIKGEKPNVANIESGAWISRSLWFSLFNQAPNVIGKLITFDEKQWQIKGIYDDFSSFESFDDKYPQQVWTYYDSESLLGKPDTDFFGGLINILVRSKGYEFTQKDLDDFWQDYTKNHTEVASVAELAKTMKTNFSFVNYRDKLLADQNTMLYLLMLTVTVMLIMACLNLLNLMLSHYQQRSAEFAMQLCLGASQNKVRAMIFLENLATFLVSAIVGVVLSAWVIRLLPEISRDNIRLLELVHLDTQTIVIAVVLIFVINLAFALAIFAQYQQQNLLSSLNNGNKGVGSGQLNTFQKALFVAQISFAVVILTATAMLAKFAYKEVTLDPGFRLGNFYMANIETNIESAELPPVEEEEARNRALMDLFYQGQEYQKEMTKTVSNSVSNADVKESQSEPLGTLLSISTIPNPENADERINFSVRDIATDYFSTFDIPILFGRNITTEEYQSNARVGLINKKLALLLRSDGDIAQLIGTELNGRQIIGIVENNFDLMSQSEDGFPCLFRLPNGIGSPRLVIELPEGETLDEHALIAALKNEHPFIKNVEIVSLLTKWNELRLDKIIQFYFITGVSLLTILLATLGSIGMAINYAAVKKFELAIRLATGAVRSQVLKSTLKAFSSLVGWTFLVALISAVGLYVLIQSINSQIPPLDWATLSLFFSALIAIVLSSIIVVVWRVINKNPLQVLREQ